MAGDLFLLVELTSTQWYQAPGANALGAKHLAPSTWYQVLATSTWCKAIGTKYSIPGTSYLVLGTKYLVPST